VFLGGLRGDDEDVRAVRRGELERHEVLGLGRLLDARVDLFGRSLRVGVRVELGQFEGQILGLQVYLAREERSIRYLTASQLELAIHGIARLLQHLGVHLGDELVLGECPRDPDRDRSLGRRRAATRRGPVLTRPARREHQARREQSRPKDELAGFPHGSFPLSASFLGSSGPEAGWTKPLSL
jgi:hypothetical protein